MTKYSNSADELAQELSITKLIRISKAFQIRNIKSELRHGTGMLSRTFLPELRLVTRRCSSAAPPSLRSSAQGVPSEVAGSSTTSFDGETSPSPSCPTCHCQALACRLSGTGWKPATLLRPLNLSIHGYGTTRKQHQQQQKQQQQY